MSNIKSDFILVHHVLLRGLDTMLHLLQKGVDFSKEANMKEEDILNARIFEDMYPFIKQVQVYTDAAVGVVARTAGSVKPSMPDTETTFAELIERTEKAKNFIKSINPETVEGIEDLKIKLPWMPEGSYFDAPTYLRNFGLQNCLFHLVTAYDILRMKGVKIGKMDFIGAVEFKSEVNK